MICYRPPVTHQTFIHYFNNYWWLLPETVIMLLAKQWFPNSIIPSIFISWHHCLYQHEFFSNGHNFCYYHFLFWCSNCSRFSQWEPLDMTLQLPLNKMIQIHIKVHGEYTPYLFSKVTSKRRWYRCMFLYMYYIPMYLQ